MMYMPPFRGRSTSGTARPVFGIGRRVYVHSPTETVAVDLTDAPGSQVLGILADGTEVEILGWRPGRRAVSETRYRVRVARQEVEGWVFASALRASRDPQPASMPTPRRAS